MRMPERPRKDEVEPTNENKLSFKVLLALFCISAIVAFVGVLFFLSKNNDEPKKEIATVDVEEKVSPVEPPAPIKSEKNIEAKNFYGVGEYKVGVDIPGGEYKVTCFENAYVAVEKNSRGSIVTNRLSNASSSVYVTVFNGQYLRLDNAEANLVGKVNR